MSWFADHAPPHIKHDYHAPDREAVLNDPSRWNMSDAELRALLGDRADSTEISGNLGSSGATQPSTKPNFASRFPGLPGVTPSPTNFGGGDPGQQQRQIQDAINAGAPLGFDRGKWQNPQHQTDKYTIGRILAAGGSIADAIAATGGRWKPKEGSTDKIVGPKGELIDVYFDEEGQRRVQFTELHDDDRDGTYGEKDFSRGSGGSGGMGGSLGGSLLEPWNVPFGYPSFQPPPAFQAPTAKEAFDDQGFQFALQRGNEALERSAAAKGTLLTTGTLKDLGDFNQGLASQQYGTVYGRRLGEYESRYGHASTDYERDYNKTLGEYQQAHNIFRQNQDSPFNKLTTLAGLGAGANSQMLGAGGTFAGLYGNSQFGNAQALGNLGMQGANAQAAGGIGASNAWTNALGNIGNLGSFYAGLYQNDWNRPRPMLPGYSAGPF